MDGEIVWKSDLFPKLVLTRLHLDLLKKSFPEVKYFQPEMVKAELWLHDHPDRVPKKNWKRFITNWMRNSVRFAQEREPVRPQPKYGDSARSLQTSPKQFGEIMKNLGLFTEKGEPSVQPE